MMAGVIQEQTVLGIIAPDASILVQNSPELLAAGAPPHIPLGKLTVREQKLGGTGECSSTPQPR